MTWTQTETTVTLTCNGTRHPDDVVLQLATVVRDGETPLQASRRVWAVADPGHNINYWTSTSTEHYCPDCTRGRQLANPTAEL